MEAQVGILVVSFVVLLVMNVPIAVAIGWSTFLTILSVGGQVTEIDPSLKIAERMANGISSFSILAIPFFILSGILMGRGGMARRLIDLAAALMGRFPGGLAYVNTLTCMMFGAISGSAVAAVSSVGGFMIPEMNRQGYGREFNVAVTTTAATTGLIIPPSNIMIVYALVTGTVSVAAMFMAGILSGIVMGLCIMAACTLISLRRGYGAGTRTGWFEIGRTFVRAVWSLLLVVIVLGGILGGVFSATEASAIAVAYAFILAVIVYREVRLKELPGILRQCGITTAIVFFLIATSQGMSWILANQNIPQTVSAALLSISGNELVILLIINMLLLFVGTFMDMTPAVLIFTPIFLPVMVQVGMDPVHFGIMMIANLCIGLCTPPVGTCLFVGCSVGKTTIARVTGPLIPFFLAMAIGLLLITYIPGLSLWIPRLCNLIGP